MTRTKSKVFGEPRCFNKITAGRSLGILKASQVGSIQGVSHEPWLGRRDCLRGLGGILVNLVHFQAQLDLCNWFLAESERDSVGTAYATMKGSE